jgi:hypothetical protein
MKRGVNVETNCPALTTCIDVCYVVRHEGTASLLSQCIVSILWVLSFWCGYVKCSVAYKGDGSRLTIYAQYSLEMTSKVGLDASLDSMLDWKWIEEKAEEFNSAKVHITGDETYRILGKSLTRIFFLMLCGYLACQVDVHFSLFSSHWLPHHTESENHGRKKL